MEMPDAPEHLKALASRLSKAHGVAEAIICQGLVALEPCVQRRLNRRITKPLDLACLRAFKAEMEGRDVAPDVRAALDQLPDKAKVEALLRNLRSTCVAATCHASVSAAEDCINTSRKPRARTSTPTTRAAACGTAATLPADAALQRPLRPRAHGGTDGWERSERLRAHLPPGPVVDGRGARERFRSLEKQQELLAPMAREGEPLVDVYAPFGCARFDGWSLDENVAFDEASEANARSCIAKARSARWACVTSARRSWNGSSSSARSVPAVYEAESHIHHHQQAV